MSLESAWISYNAFLKRKLSTTSPKQVTRPTPKKPAARNIVFIKHVKPIHFTKRTIENFIAGDEAWISWEGKKAIPVKVTEVDDRYYTFKIERPLKLAGNEYYVRLDEVRSTPLLACMNYITF
jgi:hypothetical protein